MTNFSKKKIISQKSSSSSGGGGITSVVGGTNITIDNTDPSNPIINGVATSSIIVVANYSALPAPNTVSGKFYWCSAAQGTSWLPGSLGGTYYNSGMYYSNGTTWEWLNVPYNATQAEVHTGVDNTKFVTPSTFAGEKDVTDGIVGLTGFNHNFKNTAGTFLSYFTNSNTASRTYTFQDAAGTVAFLSDITGSGTTELAAVISQTNTPAGSPTTGDRYLVGTVPTGAWVGNANNIAEWNGLSWTYTTPVLNNTVFVTATLTTLRYSGSSWIAYQGTAVLQNGNTLGTSLNIGTNDAQSVIIKVNGITRETNSTTINTVQIGTISTNAMYRLDSAGFRIGTVATIGTANTAKFEVDNLIKFSGTSNVKLGVGANAALTSGSYNIGIGEYANADITTSSANIGIGYFANRVNTAGSNIAIGLSALSLNVTGIDNIALGHGSLSTNTGAIRNIGIGKNVMSSATHSSNDNVGIGVYSLQSLTTGQQNVAVGNYTLISNTTGQLNTAIGFYSQYYQTGNYNTSLGSYALFNATASTGNVALGKSAGYYETGSNSLYIHNGVGHSTEANSKTRSLLYGQFNATLSSQQLTVNGGFRIQTTETSTDTAVRVDTVGLKLTTIANIGTSGTAFLDINESNTSKASLRIRSGVAPTTPNDGDIWFNGTDLKMQVGGVTKTFTLV